MTDKRDCLYQRLIKQGVELEILQDYQGTLPETLEHQAYGDNAVRLLTPEPGMLDELLSRFSDLT